jgi:hypothetical protein
MTTSYMNAVALIMRRGSFSNSYKFALLRSLSRFGKLQGSGEERVPIEWLAERFIEMYWPLTLNFRLRQETDPTKPPIIMKEIKSEATALGLSPETKLATYRDRHLAHYNNLVERVSRNTFGDVIERFHNIQGCPPVEPRLYEHDKDSISDGIVIGAAARAFLNEGHQTLDLLAIGGWVKFTEKFTSSPKLYEKIQGLKPQRSSLNKYRTFFLNRRVEHCFYCSSTLTKTSEVDHVVPWSFIADDKVWNLVLACDDCNGGGGKSSRTPSDEYVEKLISRNNEILEIDAAELPTSIKKDLSEWRGRDLEGHIRVLINRCRDDGFGTWHPT